MTFGTDICDAHRMKPTDVSNPLAFSLAPSSGIQYGLIELLAWPCLDCKRHAEATVSCFIICSSHTHL